MMHGLGVTNWGQRICCSLELIISTMQVPSSACMWMTSEGKKDTRVITKCCSCTKLGAPVTIYIVQANYVEVKNG
uniref:Uncharacterized protein n=1 Tax=Arundo donax TaxID=35708 RepID=A0A0A9BCA3_ARUDO